MPQKKADKSAALFAIGGADGGSNPRPKTVRFQIIGQQQTFVNKTLQAFQHIRPTMFGFVRSALVPAESGQSRMDLRTAKSRSALDCTSNGLF